MGPVCGYHDYYGKYRIILTQKIEYSLRFMKASWCCGAYIYSQTVNEIKGRLKKELGLPIPVQLLSCEMVSGYAGHASLT
jgi:hypothetical protein